MAVVATAPRDPVMSHDSLGELLSLPAMNQVSLVNPVERYMSLRIQQYTFASAMKETQCPLKATEYCEH